MRKILTPVIALCIVAIGITVPIALSNPAAPPESFIALYIASSVLGLFVLFLIIKYAVKSGVSESIRENAHLFSDKTVAVSDE